MSHRITTKTNITDKNLAIRAIKSAGWNYAEDGSFLRLSSGPMNRAAIDLKTGDITGDSDLHSRVTLEAFRQKYSEEIVRQEALKCGATIESREVLKNGDVRFILTAQFA